MIRIQMRLRFSILFLLITMGCTQIYSQVAITTSSLVYNQNFNTLATIGTANAWINNSTIVGWNLFNGSGSSLATYISDAGMSSTGSIFSYGAASANDRSIGSLGSGGTYWGSPSSGSVCGYYALSLINSTGSVIDTVYIYYDGEQWRNGGNATPQSLTFQYGFGSSFASVTSWTSVAAYNFTSPVASTTAAAVNGNVAGRVANIGGAIASLGWSNGTTLWFRWVDYNDVGNDHGLSIDSIRITAIPSCIPINPTITQQPTFKSICEGGNLNLQIKGTNYSVIQWRLNGIDIPGANDSFYTIANASSINSGVYDVVLIGNNSCSLTISDTASVLVNQKPSAMTISSASSSFNSCINDIQNLTVTGGTVPNTSTTFTWTPVTSLYTNALATSSYIVGLNATQLYANPTDTIQYTVLSTSSQGCSSQVTFTLNVLDSISIWSQPKLDTSICLGQNFSISVNALSSSPISYQWKKWNGASYVNIPGANSPIYTKTNATVIDSGNYLCEIMTGAPCLSKLSSIGHVTIYAGLSITKQPNSLGMLSICQGQPANIVAHATGQVSQQWKKIQNGVVSNYSIMDSNYIASIQFVDSGRYFVEYTLGGICGKAYSDTVKVVVNPMTKITTAPMSSSVCQGNTATIVAKAKNATSIVWLKNNIVISNGGSVSINNVVTADSTISTLTINNVALSDSGMYRFVAIAGSNGCANDSSSAFKLNVKPSVSISTVPVANTTICKNAAFSLNVSAVNVISYQWQLNGVNLINATSSSYSVASAQWADTGNYTVIMTGVSPCANVTSSIAAVKVTDLATIMTAPTSQTICQGTPLTFAASVNNATDSIVWFLGAIRKGDGTTYSVSSSTMSDSGSYRIIAFSKSGCKNDTFNNFNATIIKAPVILSQPIPSAQVCNGSSFSSLSIAAQNANSYQWKQGAVNKGGNSSTILINPFGISDTGNYTVVISGNVPCPSITSTISNVKMIDSAKIITQPVLLSDICLGGKLKLTVLANGAISYQWYKGTVALIGETKDSFVIASVSASSSGSYNVHAIANSGCVNAISSSAVVNVSNPIFFTSQPSASSICEGNTINLSTSVSGNSNPMYVWKKNGIILVAPNSSNYSKSNCTTLDSGLYTVEVTGASTCPTISSNAAFVTVNTNPSIPSISGVSPLCIGSNMVLTASASNQTGFIWKKGSTVVSTSSIYTKTTAIVDSGNYSVTAIAKTGCTNMTSSIFNQVVRVPAIITAQPQSISVLVGTSFTLSVTASNAVSYQWKKNGVIIPGATSASYSVSSFDSLLNAGMYTVDIASLSPCTSIVTSNVAIVSKVSCPSIIKQLKDTTVCLGNSFILNVSTNNLASYQWYKNGQLLPIDTLAFINRFNTTESDGGYYKVKIMSKLSSGCSPFFSDSVKVVINKAPLIAVQPMPNDICAPSTYTLNVSALNFSSFQWYKDNLPIAGSIDSTFVVNLSTSSNEGNYKVEVKGNTGCASIISLAVLVKKRIASNLVKLADSTRLDLVEQCKEGVWTYYATVAKPDEFLLAINKGNSTVTLAPDVILTSTIKDIVKVVSNVAHGFIFGKRYFNVDLINGALNSSYDVRFFYSVQDSLDVKNAFLARKNAAITSSFTNPSNGNMSWILSTSAPFTSVFLNNVSYPLFFSNIIVQNKSYGTLNGISYVDIKGANASNGGGTNYMEYSFKNTNIAIQNSPSCELNIKLFPIPVVFDQLHIEVNSPKHQMISMSIIDPMGRLIDNKTYDHTTDHVTYIVDVSKFANGTYHIKLDNGYEQTVSHFIVNK